ncbi:hypothetical protein [Streptomyces sp. Ru73]|uniref:hypothetical protein n=1 Tax=Streptomyces sp. Ru73 TaxID=2080748 RepID=UPI0011B0BCC3|nr:hypothetical protein [Streptomyces sp. Ru73]
MPRPLPVSRPPRSAAPLPPSVSTASSPASTDASASPRTAARTARSLARTAAAAAVASAFAMSLTGCMSVSDHPPKPRPSGPAGHHGSDAQPDGGSAQAPDGGPRRMGRSAGPMADEDPAVPTDRAKPSADGKRTPGVTEGSRKPRAGRTGSESPTQGSPSRPAPPRPTGYPKPTPTPSRTTEAPDPTPTPSQDPPPSSPEQTGSQSGSPASAGPASGGTQ